MKIMEMNYVAPELEVLEIMVEAGFEGSNFNNPEINTPGMGQGGLA